MIRKSAKELNGVHKLKTRKSPYDFQEIAIENVVKGFENADRGQLIMPCGTGKTLISLWIHERLDPKYTLVLFPSLALLRQTKDEWSANRKQDMPYMCVCSEKDIDAGTDSIQMSLSEIGGNVSTDPEVIRGFLQQHEQAIIFSTYQSLESVSLATKGTNIVFGLALCDEAHKTAGTQKGVYSLIHNNSIIPALRRLYMTATPRVIGESTKGRLNKEEASYIADMSDPKTFGKELHYMSFKEAIERGILVDYKIVAIGVTDAEMQAIIKEGRFTKKGAKIEEIANNYALARFMDHYDASSVISFHSSVKKAADFKERHLELFKEISTFHVNGKQSTNERHSILNEFAKVSKSIVTNARCLTEGVDIPVVDAVFFCDPKNSKIDIVQAAGRALRRADHRNKTTGYIVVPLFHRQEDDLESVIEIGAFSNLLNVIRGLNNHDERITEVMRRFKYYKDEDGAKKSRNLKGNKLNFIELEGLTESLRDRLFDEVIDNFRLPWRDFEAGRSFVHSLGLRSRDEWLEYCKSGNKPTDIPAYPNLAYKDRGWDSWGDWLGTHRIANQNKQFRSFEEARAFVHSLGLKSQAKWREYCKSGNKPIDIPSNPEKAYKDKGWVSSGDWLGITTICLRKMQYRAFEDVRSFARSLKLKSRKDWHKYCQSGRKPEDIPACPNVVYKDKGWVSWGDWLGTGMISTHQRQYRAFENARSFVHRLGLESQNEWYKYCKSGKKPSDIPVYPHLRYKDKGWISWGHWLGTNRIANQKKQYRSFEDARSFVHRLGLESQNEWHKYCKSGKKPSDIPAYPNVVYKGKGWVSWGHWLGGLRL